MFTEKYEYTIVDNKIEIAGKTLKQGEILKVKNGYVQLEKVGDKQVGDNPTFVLLAEKALPVRKDTEAGDGYIVNFLLYYNFEFRGSGSRSGKTLIHISNENGVVKVEF